MFLQYFWLNGPPLPLDSMTTYATGTWGWLSGLDSGGEVLSPLIFLVLLSGPQVGLPQFSFFPSPLNFETAPFLFPFTPEVMHLKLCLPLLFISVLLKYPCLLVLASYCCGNNSHKPSGLKQYTFISSISRQQSLKWGGRTAILPGYRGRVCVLVVPAP